MVFISARTSKLRAGFDPADRWLPLSQQSLQHDVLLANRGERSARGPVHTLILAEQIAVPVVFLHDVDDGRIRRVWALAVVGHLIEFGMAAVNVGQQRNDVFGLAIRALLHRSEEHTSELQSPCNLVCRLLLE